MNIGLLVTRFPPDVIGGAELQTKQLAAALARYNHNVTVFTRRYHKRPRREAQDGYLIVRRRELPVPAVRMFWDVIPAVIDIARHTPRPEMLICYQTFNSGLIGAVAQALLGIPAIVSIRGNREYQLGSSLANRFLVPVIYRGAQRIIVQSERIDRDLHEQLCAGGQAALSREIAPKVVVIPNGIDLDQRPCSRGTKIVYVGRLIPDKGVADLLHAVRGMPSVETLVIGDGPDRQRLERLAAGMPVTFVGKVAPAQVVDYLQQARLLVLPSHVGDGFPNVIMEAMGSGVPAVATNTAGIPDLVRHGETGFLFVPGDTEQMTAYIQRILTDDALHRQMAQRSQELIREYSWDYIVPRFEQLVHQFHKGA